ncbi:unnamed protein product [Absidia cylindrospora]
MLLLRRPVLLPRFSSCFSIRRFAGKASEKPLTESFYDDKILTYSDRPVKPVTLKQLVRFGQLPLSQSSLREFALYARTELPVRLAKRTRAFQGLPFIVGTNPYIKEIYKLYYDSFETLLPYSHTQDDTDDMEFYEKLSGLVEQHTDNIPVLAKGFLECKDYMDHQELAAFLDDMIMARIGIRLIAEQFIVLTKHSLNKDQQHNDKNGQIGIIDTQLQPSQLIHTCVDYVAELCDFSYGHSPEVMINGHLNTQLTYIPVHLEYILTELLKNAYRASMEHANNLGLLDPPPIEVTLSQSKDEIAIRIRDQGSGIPQKDLRQVFDYSYTSVSGPDDSAKDVEEGNIISGMALAAMQSGVGTPLSGLGYGLPLARMYANFFGGSLTLVSMNGYGCDVFLKLKHIDDSIAEELQI